MTVAILLVALQGALTAPTSTCAPYDVGAGQPLHYVTLEDTLTFNLNPSHPLLLVRVMVGDTLFKVSVDGTYLKLLSCDLQETNCSIIDEGGTKNSDFIHTQTWNTITISLVNDKISVSVNMRTNVMGMVMPKKDGQAVKSEVAIVNVDSHVSSQQSQGYHASIILSCNETDTPTIRVASPLPMPDTTTIRVPIYPTPDSTCAPYTVGAGQPLHYATLDDTLTFYLNPSHSLLLVRVMVGDTLFKVSVDGTMLKLLSCDDLQETNCTIIDEGGSKGSNLINPHTWNMITVSLANNNISVDVNMKTNVMGMGMARKAGQAVKSEVAIVNVDPQESTPHSPGYIASVIIFCNETEAPSIREAPPLPMPDTTDSTDATDYTNATDYTDATDSPSITTTSMPDNPAPYPECGVSTVEVDHPYTVPFVEASRTLTLAVLPSHPILELTIPLHTRSYKVVVNGGSGVISQCQTSGEDCRPGQSANIDLHVHQWNYVTINIISDGVILALNGTVVLSSTSIAPITQTPPFIVNVLPPTTSTSKPFPPPPSSYYSLLVNPKCKVADSTSSPATDSHTVGIIVGILVAALVVVAVALVISHFRKSRSAEINQHTPLQEAK